MAETVSGNQHAAFTNPQNGQSPIDADQVTANDNALRVVTNAHDAETGVHLQGSALTSRPAAGVAGRKWWVTDTKRLYRDTGLAWEEAAYLPLAETASSSTVTGDVTFSGTLAIATLGVSGVLTATLTGNADTATALATARTVGMSGDITASGVSFNGTGNITLVGAITAGVIVDADINASAAIADTKLATITTASKVANSATTGVSTATASTLALRDANADAAFRHVALNGVSYSWPSSAGASGQVLQTNGTGTLTWAAASAGFVTGSGTAGRVSQWDTGGTALTNSIIAISGGTITISSATRLALGTSPAAAGLISIPNAAYLTARDATDSADITLIGATSGNLIQLGGASGATFSAAGAATVASISAAGAASVASIAATTTSFNGVGYAWPAADGTSGYVLRTNGAGTLTWVAQAGGVSGLTAGKLTKAASATTLADSIISESGTTVTVAGTLNLTGTLQVDGVTVVANRITGYSPTFSEAASKTADCTDLPGLQALVRQLYNDMTTHGLIS